MATSYVITPQQLESLVDFPHLKRYDAQLKEWVKSLNWDTIESGVKIFYINNETELPSVGKLNHIYATKNKKLYIWNETSMAYECYGSDYNDIGLIDGGKADKDI